MDSTTQIQNEININEPGGAIKLIRQVRQATKRRLSADDKNSNHLGRFSQRNTSY